MQAIQEKKGRNAKARGWKQSDQKKLDSEGAIIAVLKAHQPLKPLDICKAAKINLSTFYRHYQVLEEKELIKKLGTGEYALWNYEEVPSYWERVKERMLTAGGRPIKLEVEKLTLGEQDPITGWYKRIFDKKVTIEGVVIPIVATDLIDAAKIKIGKDPLSDDPYVGALITRDSLDGGDRFKWQGNYHIIWQIETIYEGNEISYHIIYLKIDEQAIIDGEL